MASRLSLGHILVMVFVRDAFLFSLLLSLENKLESNVPVAKHSCILVVADK